MKILDLIKEIQNKYEISTYLNRARFRKRWTFLSGCGSFYDLSYAEFETSLELSRFLQDCKYTGILHGPESTTHHPCYSFKGFLIIPWNFDNTCNTIYIATKSILRNHRYNMENKNDTTPNN